MTLSEFWNKYKSGVDYDGMYGKQCVDYVNAYAKEVLGINDAFFGQGIRYAYQVYTDYEKLPKLKAAFTRIANSTKQLNFPLAGDIVVWAKERNGYAGHIAVVVCADAHSLTVLEQNFDGKGGVRKYTYPNYHYVLGWLRAKNAKRNRPSLTAGQMITLKQTAALYPVDNAGSGVLRFKDFTNFTGSAEAILKVGAKLKAEQVKCKSNGNIWVKTKYGGWICVYDFKKDISKV